MVRDPHPWGAPASQLGSVKELIAQIYLFAANWNAGPSPFAWVKPADEVLAKAVRKPVATNESGHQADRSPSSVPTQ